MRRIQRPDSCGCFDTSFGVTFINYNWLIHQLSKQLIAKIVTLLKIRSTDSIKYKTDKYMIVLLYLIRENHKKFLMYIWELYLDYGSWANFFIGNNILGPKSISINITAQTAYISACKVMIKLKAKQKSSCIQRKLLEKKEIIYFLKIEVVISFLFTQMFDNNKFLFEPTTSSPNIALFTHLLNYSTTKVLVCNNYNKSIQIPYFFCMGAATEVFYKNCF